jgi:hypothetical protein
MYVTTRGLNPSSFSIKPVSGQICNKKLLLPEQGFIRVSQLVIAGFRKWPDPDTRVLHSTELVAFQAILCVFMKS